METQKPPTNNGKKWSEEENEQLIKNIYLHKGNRAEVATIHERTQRSIRSQINKIAFKMRNLNVSIEEIKTATYLSEYEIKQIIERSTKNKHPGDKMKNKNIVVEEVETINKQTKKGKCITQELCEIKKDLSEIKQMLHKLLEK
jgi:hypothetical protein